MDSELVSNNSRAEIRLTVRDAGPRGPIAAGELDTDFAPTLSNDQTICQTT
jgi:hypothetical protein